MDISARKLSILAAVIEDYIMTGVPVGSRTISKKPGMEVSSATIRNEMADLEELGYLEQPHTSAGRIPSDMAYRLYVDRLMRTASLTPAEARSIKQRFSKSMGAMEDVIRQTADVLSQLTDQISIVLAPKLADTEIRRIQLVRITETRALLLIVTSSGLVRDVLINLPAGVDQRHLELLSAKLTELAYDKKLSEAGMLAVEPLLTELELKREFVMQALSGVSRESRGEVVLGGQKNIFNFPEYRDVEKAKNFLEVLETKSMLERLLTSARDLEFTIRIGQENELSEFRDMSVVTATYKIGGSAIGSFGVIGPTRMDYAKVIAVLQHVSGSLNEILGHYIDNE